MKQLILGVLLMGSLISCGQQTPPQTIPGQLIADTTQIKKDTMQGKIAYFKGMEVAVDSAYIITYSAPMVFQTRSTSGDKSERAKTDKVQIIKVEYYIHREKRLIDTNDIIAAKIKK